MPLPPQNAVREFWSYCASSKDDNAAADRYAAVCLEKTKDVEPVLKAFEYLPRDISRRPGPLSGIPVAIKDIIATADMPTTNGSPVYRDSCPQSMPGLWNGCAISARRFSARPCRPSLRGGIRGRRSIPGIQSTRRAARRRARQLRLRPACAAGARHPNAGIGGQAGRLQRRGRFQAELWRDPPHRRSSAQPLARSRRLLCPACR